MLSNTEPLLIPLTVFLSSLSILVRLASLSVSKERPALWPVLNTYGSSWISSATGTSTAGASTGTVGATVASGVALLATATVSPVTSASKVAYALSNASWSFSITEISLEVAPFSSLKNHSCFFFLSWRSNANVSYTRLKSLIKPVLGSTSFACTPTGNSDAIRFSTGSLLCSRISLNFLTLKPW